jgi:hypothetical protein
MEQPAEPYIDSRGSKLRNFECSTHSNLNIKKLDPPPRPVILSLPEAGEESLPCKVKTLRFAQGDKREFLSSGWVRLIILP